MYKQSVFRKIAIFVVVCILSGCGGGGGTATSSGGGSSTGSSSSSTSGGDSNGSLTVSLSPSSINHQASVAGEVQVLFVTGTASGDLGVSTLYVGADADVETFRSITFYQDTDSVSAQIETHETLWGGTYTGNISIYLCSDANCNNHLANSPLTLPYNIVIPKSGFRMEPINYNTTTVVDYDREFVAISAESGTAGVAVQYKTELSASVGELVFPEQMLADFQITNASEEGFTLITPTLADGSYTFNYTLGFTNSENTIPFTVYYLVGREGGANNQFIFFEDPIEIDALYGSPNNYHSTRYLVTGENRDILDYKEFTVEYIDGADWLGWPSGSDDYLHLDLNTENLPLGTYRARIHGSTFYTQATGSVDVIVNVVDGFDIFNQFNEVRFDQYLYSNETRSAYVDNSRQAQGEWTASTTTPWITLLNTSGNFLTPEERENYSGDSSVEYTFNVEGITALPNNSTGTGTITFSSEDVRFPDKSIEINYVKEFPQITALSQTQVVAGQPFSLAAQGINLGVIAHEGVGLREGDNQYLYEAYFTVDEATLTQESVMLTHPGIAQPGVYEIVINHTANRDSSYQQAYVPRVSITVVEAE